MGKAPRAINRRKSKAGWSGYVIRTRMGSGNPPYLLAVHLQKHAAQILANIAIMENKAQLFDLFVSPVMTKS